MLLFRVFLKFIFMRTIRDFIEIRLWNHWKVSVYVIINKEYEILRLDRYFLFLICQIISPIHEIDYGILVKWLINLLEQI